MPDRPKILLLGPLPPPYMGPAIATKILINSKLKDRFHLFFLNTGIHKSINTLGTWGLKSILMNAWIYAKLKIKIIRCQPDLVLIPISQTTNGFVKDSLYILIARFFHRRVLLQLRGSNFLKWLRGSGRMTRVYVHWILKKTSGMIVLGKKLRELFIDHYPENRIFVVPNGADYNFPPVVQNDESIHLLYLGNMLPEKGIMDLLRAISELQKKEVKQAFRLDVMGSWNDSRTRNHCFKMLRELNLPVVFHHPDTGINKYQLLANAHVLVFTPNKPEGHPWVLVEALAAGLPVISTDQGAISESVVDGINGFMVETESPGAIANKLKALIEDPILRKKMGKNSRRFYEERFTEEKMVERLSSVFNQVLEN
jgi:glycosyltransferase involved in cell wall biosynthesis